MSREAMQMALEALESDPITHVGLVNRKQAITALRQALEEKREPVAWYCNEGLNRGVSLKQESPKWAPLYTAPPKREWVGLTGEEIKQTELSLRQYNSRDTYDLSLQDFADAIEAKLKEKNHG